MASWMLSIRLRRARHSAAVGDLVILISVFVRVWVMMFRTVMDRYSPDQNCSEQKSPASGLMMRTSWRLFVTADPHDGEGHRQHCRGVPGQRPGAGPLL